ncbi:MAG TPA: aminodeoxychorismate synthase component I [Bryobacteraceae bacterium]|nr:aminodeoxychorismate synthase component I [Bryobacteraceae bacterium]
MNLPPMRGFERGSGVRTLIIDNYDSFTFNLFQLIGQVNGEEPVVVRNDQCSWAELAGLGFDNVVISPGPGNPGNARDFGICKEAILRAKVPVLGVCLGHQGLGLAYGGEVRRAPEPMHGRISRVRHDGSRLFTGIPQDFQVVRYHSLIVSSDLTEYLRGTAWTADGILMAMVHRDLPRFGIQFHPESICTEYGDLLLKNFRDLTPRSPRVGYAKAKHSSVVPHPPTSRAVPSSKRVCSRKVAFETGKAGAAFSALYGSDPYSFWLDSSLATPGVARFSFMGRSDGPVGTEDTYKYLSEELRRRRCHSDELPFDFNCGFVGYFAYSSGRPDAKFLFADRVIAIDHETSEAWLVSYGLPEEAAGWMDQTAHTLASLPPDEIPAPVADETLTFRLRRNKSEYLDDIARCQEFIRAGESYEICLTNQITASAVRDPLALYKRLRLTNPAPYSAFLRFGELAVLSCSPERFLRIDRSGVAEARPMKGTRPRGRTPHEDETLRRDLKENEKDRSENLMIVDLLRNDLGLVCEIGSVRVPKLMEVETYATVHQLVSTITGWLRPGIDAVGCVRAAFPGGSMTGAPKMRTMELLEQLEAGPRGIYSGSIGFLALNGTADLNIIIRTLLSTPTETTIGIGGAIVALSDAEAEFEETLVKARALVHGLIADKRGTADEATVDRVLADLRSVGLASLA